MIDRIFTIVFNLAALASGIGDRVTPDDVRSLMTDPRVATPIIKRRIAADRNGWTLVKARGGSDELRDPHGDVWQVKSISPTGRTLFAPSKQIGLGRHIDPAGVVANWAGLKGYFLADIATFPEIRVYIVPIATVEGWHAAGRLPGYAASRATLLNQLLTDPDRPR